MNEKILIIIPAYNEADSIGLVIDNLRINIPQADILVINDGSEDATSELAKAKGVMVVDLPFNIGIGATMQTGFLFAQEKNYTIAVQVDGDGQHNSEDIPILISSLQEKKADLVIGSRYIKRNEYNGYTSTVQRKVGIKFFSFLIFLLTHRYVTDPTSGFRAINRKSIEFFAKEYPSDYPEPESLILLFKKKFLFSEIPVTMDARQGGVSSISFTKAFYYMFKVTLSIVIGVLKQID